MGNTSSSLAVNAPPVGADASPVVAALQPSEAEKEAAQKIVNDYFFTAEQHPEIIACCNRIKQAKEKLATDPTATYDINCHRARLKELLLEIGARFSLGVLFTVGGLVLCGVGFWASVTAAVAAVCVTIGIGPVLVGAVLIVTYRSAASALWAFCTSSTSNPAIAPGTEQQPALQPPK